MTEQRRRVHLLDEIRGLCILLMVIYHGAYDLIYLFGVNIPLFHWPIIQLAQPFVAGIFILISGVACRYSRSNLRRGAIALGLGVGISLVTWFLMPGQMIWFGILHFMGSAMMLFALLRPLLDRIGPVVGIIGCSLLFGLTMQVPNGKIGLIVSAELPASLYSHRWLLPFGFGGEGADYFPMIPWLFVFLAGSFLGKVFLSGRMPEGFYRLHVPALAAVGRHTILIYVLHQPVVYGLLWVFFWLVRR